MKMHQRLGTILLLLVIAVCPSMGQHINLNTLIAMRMKSYDDINRIVLPLGWVFQGITGYDQREYCNFKKTTWRYNKNLEDINKTTFGLGEASGINCPTFIAYQSNDIKYYQKLILEIDKLKMKHITSTMQEDGGKTYLLNEYKGAKYIIRLRLFTNNSSGSNTFTMHVYDKNF